MKNKTFIIIFLLGILCISRLNAEDATGGFTVQTEPQFKVNVGNAEVFSLLQVYFAKPDWKVLHSMVVDKENVFMVTGADGIQSAIYRRNVPDVGEYEVKIVWAGRRIEYSFSCNLIPGSQVGYVVNDIFLAKGVFDREKLLGKFAYFKPGFYEPLTAAGIELPTTIGVFKFDTSGREWILRDAEPDKWRINSARSLSIANRYYNLGPAAKMISAKLVIELQ